jgi:predicted ATPase
MSKLDRIKIKGYKSIKELDLKLTNLNVLIGANGVGKSNFISFLKMLNFLVREKLQLFVVKAPKKADSLLFFGRKHTKEIEGKLKFGDNIYEFTLEPTEANNLIFGHESAIYTKKGSLPKPPAFTKSGHEETYLYKSDKESSYPWTVSSYVIKSLKNWIVYHFHDTSENAGVKQVCDITNNKSLMPDASNLAAYLYLLQKIYPENYKHIVSNIQLVAPFFDDFSLRPDPITPSSIQLEWTEKNSDAYFNAYSLSDGTLRFICLATLLLQPKLPETIIIDEPELGLHPYAISVLASLIRKASSHTQIIISTQSVQLVDEFEPENIIVVDRENDASVFRRLTDKMTEEELKEWLEDYSLGETWKKNVFGGRP